jgi:hypothetical protein
MPQTPFDIYELLCKIHSFLPRHEEFVSNVNSKNVSSIGTESIGEDLYDENDSLSFLPSFYVDSKIDQAIFINSRVMFERVCMNWLAVSRRRAFRSVYLENNKTARRFLKTLKSNEACFERNPCWPRMNTIKSLDLGNVSGLFIFL